MIILEHWETFNFDGAMRGMRNPMNSWHKGDTSGQSLGQNDLDLLLRLTKAGTDHRKVLRQMMVSVDITAPLYWWKEADQYRIGVTTNSCSTMHKLTAKPFELADFSTDGMSEDGVGMMELQTIVLNELRELWLENKQKNNWRDMVCLLPCSYNQKRTVTLNYEVLLNMYFARRRHKLQEWRDFCEAVMELPYFKEIAEAAGKKKTSYC